MSGVSDIILHHFFTAPYFKMGRNIFWTSDVLSRPTFKFRAPLKLDVTDSPAFIPRMLFSKSK